MRTTASWFNCGTEVYSMTSGTAVVYTSGQLAGAGNTVVVTCGTAVISYMHLCDDWLASGPVFPGSVIGYVGHSGGLSRSNTHVHIQIKNSAGQSVDPMDPVHCRLEFLGIGNDMTQWKDRVARCQ
ncbi:MAG: M23 family metallopeptidase [Flavobacteriales bacterium]|nr:M23 family metallopeptidase [Flavobacteriales bacterium]